MRLPHANISCLERAISFIGGAALIINGAYHRDRSSAALQVILGGVIASRGVIGHCPFKVLWDEYEKLRLKAALVDEHELLYNVDGQSQQTRDFLDLLAQYKTLHK